MELELTEESKKIGIKHARQIESKNCCPSNTVYLVTDADNENLEEINNVACAKNLWVVYRSVKTDARAVNNGTN